MSKRLFSESSNNEQYKVKRIAINDVIEAVHKISNIELSDEQRFLQSRLMDFITMKVGCTTKNNVTSVFIITGDAGTGKSVVLNSLFNQIQKLSRTTQDQVLSNTRNYLIVNHPEMLKLYHNIAKKFPYINKTDIERPTTIINRFNNNSKFDSIVEDEKPIDILIIDEAHLLATFKDPFKKFNQDNHLQELLKLSKILIIVFDDKQSLRMGSFWTFNKSFNGSSLMELLKYNINMNEIETFNLTKQFRVVCELDCWNWIKEISTTKKILPLPIKDLNFESLSNFEFRIFKNCSIMYDHIKLKNSQYGQSRILSTYDFPYRLDGKDYFVYSQSDEFKLRWDRYLPNSKVPWSEREDTIDEVGSVYTIQGFDLNYAGVILGRSIGYDAENDCLKINPKFYDDRAAFTKKANIKDVDMVKERIILNSLNVLLTRGIKGLYLFAWDNDLRERLIRSNDPRIII